MTCVAGRLFPLPIEPTWGSIGIRPCFGAGRPASATDLFRRTSGSVLAHEHHGRAAVSHDGNG